MTGPANRTSSTHGFLFADLRGYTSFIEKHGDLAAVELLTAYRALVREAVARQDGAEIRTEGDGFYVVFPTASAAVRGGLEILDVARRVSEAGGPRIEIGIGVHAGETAESEQGLVGSAVNIAARICSIAGPGELLVSETVRSLTRTLLRVRFVRRGSRTLKGITEPVALYSVQPGDAPVVARERRMRGPLGSATGLTRGLIALGAVAALGLGLVVVASALLVRGGEPGASGGAAPSTLQGAGSTGTRFSPAEAALVARLPVSVAGPGGSRCRPTEVSERALQATASIRCDMESESDADTLWVDQVAESGIMAQYFYSLGNGRNAPKGDCAKATGVFGTWEMPNVGFLKGMLRCYQDSESRSWIVWTYDRDALVLRALRGDLNSRALYDWWKGVAFFLKDR